MDDVLLNKFANLERYIKRVREEYKACRGDIEHDILRQDSIVLNLERACEQCIKMGQRVIRQKKLDLAKEYRDVFNILEQHKIIPHELAEDLKKMAGFRNFVVHEYDDLDVSQIKYIVEHRLAQLLEFGRLIIKIE